MTEERTLEEFLAEHPGVVPAYERVRSLLDDAGPCEVRATKSQIAFRRRRGFAYLWLPRMYVRSGVDVVLSIALERHLESTRFKEVVEPRPGLWMHHLELSTVDDLDAEVAGWLAEAAEAAT